VLLFGSLVLFAPHLAAVLGPLQASSPLDSTFSRIATLSPTHSLVALAHRLGSKRVLQHRHSIARLDYDTQLWVHSSFAKVSHNCHLLTEPFDADADEARLGHHLMDLFSWRIHFKESESKEDVDQAKFLEWQFDLSDVIPSCILVTDASVPTEGKWQATSAAWLWHGGKFLCRTHHAAGRVTAPDAKLYAIQIGLGLATVPFHPCWPGPFPGGVSYACQLAWG
jgi:hypothetical protein